MEYLKYSIKVKIIEQVSVFDFKKNKEIITKTKYYFTDTNFRNSLYDFELNISLLKENFLFTELKKSGYKINS
jgi:predicted AAA+ superfamily ATPase